MNEREIQEDELVIATDKIQEIMEHLDRTFWLGDDVSEQLETLMELLGIAQIAASALRLIDQKGGTE